MKWVRIEQGSTFTAVSSKDIKSISISFPSIEEQTQIANFLTPIDDKINHTPIQLEKTRTFKKDLLQKIFMWNVQYEK